MSTSVSRRVPFVVSFGQEELYLDRDLERARAASNQQVVCLDGKGLSEDDVVSECETRAFDGRDRRVVLDNAQVFKSTKRELAEYIDRCGPEGAPTVLVAIVRAAQPGPLWERAISKGKAVERKRPKPWERGKKTRCIEREAGRLKLSLDEGIADLLLRVCGDDLRQIVRELSKLVYLVGEGGVVRRGDVAKVVTRVYPAEPYDVAQAAGQRNARKAMTLFAYLYRHLGVGACVIVVSSLQRLAEKLIVARQLLDMGEGPAVIAVRFDMKEYPFKKNLLPMVQRHTVVRLRDQMKKLCRLEAYVKGSGSSKRTKVELAILSFAS